ncbi:MAG: hypothetical protein LBV66_01735 [Elusimicrobiota bacterium]|jgi:hypothetical protein|nr:hypothetical protein [Elusimicrobiota bacterium]
MNLPKILISFIFLSFILFSCGGASYPKENLDKSLTDLVKQETGLDSEITIVGNTIYLDIEIEGFLSQDSQDVSAAFKKMQTAFSDIMRVVLSSDADINFMVINAFPPKRNAVFRLIQSIDDFKNYYFVRISKDDYESRTIFEVVSNAKDAQALIKDKHDMDIDEYVGRMIVAFVQMKFRANPFLGEMILPTRLTYNQIKKDSLIVATPLNSIDSETKQILQTSFLEAGRLFIQKYDTKIKRIQIVSSGNKTLISIRL